MKILKTDCKNYLEFCFKLCIIQPNNKKEGDLSA